MTTCIRWCGVFTPDNPPDWNNPDRILYEPNNSCALATKKDSLATLTKFGRTTGEGWQEGFNIPNNAIIDHAWMYTKMRGFYSVYDSAIAQFRLGEGPSIMVSHSCYQTFCGCAQTTLIKESPDLCSYYDFEPADFNEEKFLYRCWCSSSVPPGGQKASFDAMGFWIEYHVPEDKHGIGNPILEGLGIINFLYHMQREHMRRRFIISTLL